MRKKPIPALFFLFALVTGCGAPIVTPQPTPILPPPTQAVCQPVRTLLTADALTNGFAFDSPVDELALTPPDDSAAPIHIFEGRLELLGEKENGHINVLRGELEPEYPSLPEFDFEFVQDNGDLIPVRRGNLIADHPIWNIILEPGRVWQEEGDGDFSRASLPFALTVKGGNATFNGTLTFLFDDQRVSKVWYQVTQETTTYTRADLWGLLDAAYHPGAVNGSGKIRADFAAELAARMPVKPIEALAEDYPGVDVSAFGRGVTPEHMTWYGVAVNEVNYTTCKPGRERTPTSTSSWWMKCIARLGWAPACSPPCAPPTTIGRDKPRAASVSGGFPMTSPGSGHSYRAAARSTVNKSCNPDSLEAASTAIRGLFNRGAIPADIAAAVASAYAGLDGTAVAVHSSATAEDLPEASFAGQQETF